MTPVGRAVRRVLVVDDDANELERARDWMPGREVLSEQSASRTLERVRAEIPCLVILDLWLDGTHDGMQLANALKAENPSLPVAIISGGLTARWAVYVARKCAADVILSKQGQSTFEEIIACVERGLDPDPWGDRTASICDMRREFARRLMAQTGGNKSRAARQANVSLPTFRRWLREEDAATTEE